MRTILLFLKILVVATLDFDRLTIVSPEQKKTGNDEKIFPSGDGCSSSWPVKVHQTLFNNITTICVLVWLHALYLQHNIMLKLFLLDEQKFLVYAIPGIHYLSLLIGTPIKIPFIYNYISIRQRLGFLGYGIFVCRNQKTSYIIMQWNVNQIIQFILKTIRRIFYIFHHL